MTRTRSDGFVVDSGVTTSLFGGGGWPGHRGGAHSWIGRGARGSAGSTNASSISASGSSFSSAPACEQTEQTTTLRREPATRARAVGRARWRARSLSLSYSARSLSLSLSLSPSSSFATVLSPSSSFATVFGRALLVLPRTARLCALLPRNRRRGEKKASVSAASRVAAAFGGANVPSTGSRARPSSLLRGSITPRASAQRRHRSCVRCCVVAGEAPAREARDDHTPNAFESRRVASGRSLGRRLLSTSRAEPRDCP